jgi:hypothetical protein
MRPIIVLAHGILTRQTVASWPDQFHAWLERQDSSTPTPHPIALKKEYIAGPFPLWNVLVKNRLLARGLAAEVALFFRQNLQNEQNSNSDNFVNSVSNPQLHFIAHSNGTDVALKTIQLLADRGIVTDTLIAIGSVLPSDIERNGVLDLLLKGHLRRAIAYSSLRDYAIRVGQHTVGYGSLGRHGWTLNVRALLSVTADLEVRTPAVIGGGQIFTRRFDDFGHSTYFDPTHREQTFALLARDCGLAVRQNSQNEQNYGGGGVGTARPQSEVLGHQPGTNRPRPAQKRAASVPLANSERRKVRQNLQNEQNSGGASGDAAIITKPDDVPASPLPSTGRGIKGEGWECQNTQTCESIPAPGTHSEQNSVHSVNSVSPSSGRRGSMPTSVSAVNRDSRRVEDNAALPIAADPNAAATSSIQHPASPGTDSLTH